MSVAENIAAVRERIDQAASRADRDPGDVELLVVTKYHTVDEMLEVHAAGHRLIGENRVQEAQEKFPQVPDDFERHMIGHIQTNKAKLIPGLFSMAHSVDSLRLANALNKAQRARGDGRFDILLEINVSGEETKFGFTPADAESVLPEIASLPGLRVRGLMTMAPHYDDPEQTRDVFRNLRLLRDRLRELDLPNAPLDHLSMGMSNDFEIAVEEGATLVRVGSAVFA